MYNATRSDGEDLGTYDRLDDAQAACEEDAAEGDYFITWFPMLGGTHQGKASTSGEGVFNYTITRIRP